MSSIIDLTFDDEEDNDGTELTSSLHIPVTDDSTPAQILEDSATEVELVDELAMSQHAFHVSSQPPGRQRGHLSDEGHNSASASQTSNAQLPSASASGPEVIQIEDSPVQQPVRSTRHPSATELTADSDTGNSRFPRQQLDRQQAQLQHLFQQSQQQQYQQQQQKIAQLMAQQLRQQQRQQRLQSIRGPPTVHVDGAYSDSTAFAHDARSSGPVLLPSRVDVNQPAHGYTGSRSQDHNMSASGSVQGHAPVRGMDVTMASLASHQHHSRFAPAHRPVPAQQYLRTPGSQVSTEQQQQQPVVLHRRTQYNPPQRMHMLGQLRAVVTISPGSEHFRNGSAAQFPAKLKKRPGLAQEVEVFDSRNGLIGTLEQSVTRTIYALLSDGAIQVMCLMIGPLRGKFIAPILLSFYAGMALARDVVKIFEKSGIYLDQSSAETQSMLRELDMDSNRLTQGMAYVSRHPTRDESGLMNVNTNSDVRIPSVFADMGLQAASDGSGGDWQRKKAIYRSLPLPEQMRVEKHKVPDEDPKARLANIKSTFVTLLDLPEREAPSQVTTALRRHQKQALFFMVHRETEGVDVEEEGEGNAVNADYKLRFPKLWHAIKGGAGGSECVYKHALVGIKSLDKPQSLLGGILADDMGLGKTLSILSLVLTLPPTRPRAARMKFVTADSEPLSSFSNSNSTVDKLATSQPIRNENGKRVQRRPRIARSNSQCSKKSASDCKGKGVDTGPSNGSKAIDVGDDSDSFTDLPPRKRPCRAKKPPRLANCNGRASACDSSSSVQSDSDDLVDDPLVRVIPKLRQSKPAAGDEAEFLSGEESAAAPSFANGSDSDSDSDSVSGSDNFGSDSYMPDDRPMTPPPEFDNMATRKKEVCERTFGENYHGRYAGRTLIICPLSTLGNWEEQVKAHILPRSLSVHAYHGSTRARDPKKLCQYDIVLTTYNVLQIEYRRELQQLVAENADPLQAAGRSVFDSSSEEESNTKLFQVPNEPYVSPLQAVHWHRVVLDEAHSIKERRTKSSMAAFSLTADRRWCLTGTPIQNRLDDLFSLLRFLHAAPISNWRVWLTYFGGPFHENVRNRADRETEFEEHNIGANRVQRLMQSICLRRMKQQIDKKTNRTMIELPPKFEVVRWLELAEGERRLYQMAEDIARNKYQNMSRSGTLLKNYMSILQIILRLRQLCTHPRLWSEDKWKEAHVLAADAAIADAHTLQLPAASDNGASSCSEMPEPKCEPEPKPRLEARPKLEDKPAVKAEAKCEAKPETKPETKPEAKTVVKPETKVARTHNAADLCAVVMATPSMFDESDLSDKWRAEASARGIHVKCDYCGENAIPPALLPGLHGLGASAFAGPGVTKCMHIACRKCQIILFGVAPSNPREKGTLLAGAAASALTECVLCGEMLGLSDVTHLSVQEVVQSLVSASGGAAAMSSSDFPTDPLLPSAATGDNANEDYDEINRMCKTFDTSTKAMALMKDIDKIRARQWIADADFQVDQSHPSVAARQTELQAFPDLREKCVVFSQWTSMLDLIQPLLQQRNIRFTRLDGKMQRPQRDKNLAMFKSDPGVEVLLLSLRAGGVGLNLAYATHVFLMDAFWNPSVESQAIDRIHRLGQKSPVTVTRYFVRNSIEEKILKLQNRKAKVADISLMDSTRFRNPNADAEAALGSDDDDSSLAITTGTHSRQQRLDDLSMLFG